MVGANNVSEHGAARDVASNDARDGNKQLVSSIQGKLRRKSPISSKCCIFKVPKFLCQQNPNAYEPSTVSIGPLHHGKESLKSMEELKLWYLYALLSRAPTPQTTLEQFTQVILGSKDRVLECYAEQSDKLYGDEFIEMMIVDGCFLIELFRKYYEKSEQDIDDPIFNTTWMLARIQEDLMLLENQLPWFVLDRLFNLTTSPSKPSLSLIKLALNFFHPRMPAVSTEMEAISRSAPNPVHLLDLLLQYICHSSRNMDPNDDKWEQIPCVTDLQAAGIKVKVGNANDILDVNFNNGVLEIPPLIIQDGTDYLLRNLIAFEQCYHGCKGEITSYAILLDDLINSVDDVHVLKEKRIFLSWLGSDEEVCNFFNTLCNGVTVLNYHFVELRRQINEYHRKDWNKWRATLKSNYFNSPWAAISVIAACVLLVFTFLQTVFIIFPRS